MATGEWGRGKRREREERREREDKEEERCTRKRVYVQQRRGTGWSGPACCTRAKSRGRNEEE